MTCRSGSWLLLLLLLYSSKGVWGQPEGRDWRYAEPGATYVFPTLSPDGSTVYVASDDELGEKGKVTALDASSSKVLWAYPTSKPVTAAPVVSPDGKIVYVGARDYKVCDQKDDYHGDLFTTYTHTLFVRRPPYAYLSCVRPLSRIDCTCITRCRSNGGLAHPHDPKHRAESIHFVSGCLFRELLSRPLPAASPHSLHNLNPLPPPPLLLLSLAPQVHALSSANGAALWGYETGGLVTSSPLVSRDGAAVFVGSSDFNLYRLDSLTGALEWAVRMDAALRTSPALSPTGDVVVGAGKKVVVLEPENGALRWAYASAAGGLSSPPAVSSDGATVFVGTYDSAVLAIQDGKLLWSVTVRKVYHLSSIHIYIHNSLILYSHLRVDNENPHFHTSLTDCTHTSLRLYSHLTQQTENENGLRECRWAVG